MCGRFAQSDHSFANALLGVIADLLRGEGIPDRYNICPTREVFESSFEPLAEGALRAHQASRRVDNPHNDDANCVESF